jgi:hypothetical protein
MKAKFTAAYESVAGRLYDSNCYSLAASMFECLRPCRPCAESMSDDWLFCSELVATINVSMGIFPPTVEPKNVCPMDLIGFDRDDLAHGGCPNVYDEPIVVLGAYWSRQAMRRGL